MVGAPIVTYCKQTRTIQSMEKEKKKIQNWWIDKICCCQRKKRDKFLNFFKKAQCINFTWIFFQTESHYQITFVDIAQPPYKNKKKNCQNIILKVSNIICKTIGWKLNSGTLTTCILLWLRIIWEASPIEREPQSCWLSFHS